MKRFFLTKNTSKKIYLQLISVNVFTCELILQRTICLLLIGLTVFFSGCQTDTKGWAFIHVENSLVNLQIVPEIGGRVLQYRLGDYDFFLVDEQLYGKKPPVSGVGPDGEWLNYGGDKLWLAPQGWDNEQQWPGPPDPVLDGQPYALEVLSPKVVRLTSGEDQRSGVQLSRVIKMHEGTTRVDVTATMKNIDTKPRRWGIWVHTQFNAGNRHGRGYNENYWAYCPLNRNSVFPKGYDVQYGLVNNMSYKPDYDAGMMRVHYQRRVGKIGIDSPAGWVATVDATDGYVFVHRFEHEPNKPYPDPDNSSVEIWMNGLGEFVAWGKVNQMPNDVKENPYIFESEVISPYANLEPGQEYNYDYKWYSAKIPTGTGVISCNEVGVICEPLKAEVTQNTLALTGKFGAFYEGTANICIVDRGEHHSEFSVKSIEVSPLEELNLNLKIAISEELSRSAAILITLFDKNGNLIGELTNAVIKRE